jgi:transposase
MIIGHMDRVVQLTVAQGPGCDYYDRKRAEGKTSKEAIRALKRQISDVVFRTLVADARRAAG